MKTPVKLKYKSKAYRARRKIKMSKHVKNSYHFKRLTQSIQIYHNNGKAGDIWNINDPAGQLTPLYADNTVWGSSALSGTYTNSFVLSQRLNNLQAPSDFTNLFDRYKLNGCKVTFMYQISEATAGAQQVLPMLSYAVDYDDLSPPTENQMRQKQDVKRKILTANRPYSIYFKPKRLVTVADPAGTVNTGLTTSMITSQGWINCDYPQVTHLGLKFKLDNLYSGLPATTNVQAILDVNVSYYFSCKDPQ